MDTLGLVGTIASVVGAVISIVAAQFTKTKAKRVAEAINNFETRMGSNELVKIVTITKELQGKLSKYITASSDLLLVGVNKQLDINDLHGYTLELNEHKLLILNKCDLDISKIKLKLEKHRDQFSNTDEYKELKKISRDISLELDKILTQLNKSISELNKLDYN